MALNRSALDSRSTPELVQRIFAPLQRAIVDARFGTKADYRRRTLDAGSIVIALVFSQMRRLASLRAIVEALEENSRVRAVLGLPVVKRSTLSDALSGRLRKKHPDTRLLDFTQALFKAVARDATSAVGDPKSAANAFLAVDGTVFSATAKMLFARFDSTRNALKAHVAFSVGDYVPSFVALTKATACEKTELRKKIKRGRTYILDRGYVGFDLFRAIIRQKAKFITRMKRKMKVEFQRAFDVPADQKRQGVLRDEIVRLDGGSLRLRLVVFRAADGRVFTYLTNHYGLTALEIADFYKNRWAVETFFKFLKHSLVTRHLMSRTIVGFHIQLLSAIIAYLLFAIHLGPNRDGRPPVPLSQLRQLADRLYEAIILASEALFQKRGHAAQRPPSCDSIVNRAFRGPT